MEEIKLYIISNGNVHDNEMDKNELNKNNENELDDINISKDIKEEYKIWLKDLIILMNSCSYRKVLGEIEKNKNKYKLLDIQELLKYKIIKLKAIFGIIKRKLKKYKQEIKRENSYQNKSIKFWFNQIYFILEELINNFDPEKNNTINIYSIDIIKPIQNIFENYLELFYLLIIFYKEANDITPIFIYFSLIDILMPYMDYLTNYKSIYLLQKLFLFRAKIYLENRNYILTLEYQKNVIKLCFRIFLFVTNVYKGLDNIDEDKYIKSSFIKKIYNIFVNFLFAFYLRGITFEKLGYLTKALQAYKFCKWIYFKFLIDDNELLGIFLSKIQNNATIKDEIINDIKKIIEKRKNLKMNKINKKDKKLFINKNKYKLKHNRNISYNRYNTEKFKTEDLENYLDNIGQKLYREEENRNNNLITKFTKSRYIISTITMIDNLLSKDFKNVLLKMKKIEITKPKDEIKSLINNAIIEKRRKILNFNIAKSRGKNSIMNQDKDINEKDNINNKSFLIKNEIKNNIMKKMKNYNKRKINFCINTSASINLNNYNNSNYNKNNNKNSNSLTSLKISSYNKRANSTIYSARKIDKSYLKKNLSSQDIKSNNIKKYTLIKPKNKDSKYTSTMEKVIEYPIDKYEFSKSFLKKKNYIDKYLDKEIDFHKKLLNSKKYEIEKTSDIEFFNLKNIKNYAKREFDINLNMEKNKYHKENMYNLFSLLNTKQFKKNIDINKKEIKKEEESDIITTKIENDMLNARKKKHRRLGIIEINQKKLVWQNNEGKMKKLNAECDDISHRQKKLQNKRRNIIIKIGNKK